MFVSKNASFFAVAAFAAILSGTEVHADDQRHTRPVGLPIQPVPVLGVPVMGRPAPRPIGLPMPPRPPVVGLPGPRPPRPPHPVGLPLPPRPIGMPPRPFPIGKIVPPVGLPIPPRAQYELECNAVRGNVSGIERLKLDIEQVNFGAYQVSGHVRYSNGARANVNTIGNGSVGRGNVDLNLVNVGSIAVRPTRVGFRRTDIRGDVYLYGTLDRFGLSCDIDRE